MILVPFHDKDKPAYPSDEKHTVSIPYKEYRKYIRLKDSHIPSLYQKDTAVARAQPKVDPKEDDRLYL